MKRVIKWVLIGVVVLFLALFLLPLNRTNPPVTQEVAWDAPATRALAARACFDCHSNETVWPIYARIPPANILLWRHVTEGREHFNFSEWNRPQPSWHEIEEQVAEGEMPPWDYLLLHGPARLSDVETEQLLKGLAATYQKDPPQQHEHGHDD